MHEYVSAKDSKDRLDPDIAQGYWFLERFVPEWTSHENFPRPESPYYEDCLMRISDLAWFYFIGESPYMDGGGFDTL